MLEYKNNPNNNIVEITLEGKITEADFEQVVSQMKADIDKHGKLRMLEEVRSFEGIDPITLWKDAKFGLAHINDFSHVAVIVEPTWIQTWSQAVDNVLSAKVKAFAPSQIEQAREWLANAPEPSKDSIVEYHNNLDNNIVEITVEGQVSLSDFDRVISQMQADFKKHGKLRLLEEVRSFEGMDPMTLWKDMRFAVPHLNDITHVAVVTDTKWMRTLSEAFSSVFSGQVKAFELSQIETAREWLLNAPQPSQDSKFEYRNHPHNNIVEITIEGKITEADFDHLLAQTKADFKKHGKLRVLEEVRSLEGIDPMALWKDMQQTPRLKDITHAAIVADAKWMQTMAEAVGSVIPAQVKAFELSQIEAAREWLLNAPEPSQTSKIEYRNNPVNNIVEITIEGKITAVDFDRVISLMKADFKRHEKLCILEEIRSFEGIDPMALWQDIQFGLPHINDIARVAVVTEQAWIQTFASAIDNILKAEVKAFDLSEIEQARKWLASA